MNYCNFVSVSQYFAVAYYGNGEGCEQGLTQVTIQIQ